MSIKDQNQKDAGTRRKAQALRGRGATRASKGPGSWTDPAAGKAAFEVVALAASAGGLQALIQVLSGLPAGFPASVVVVQHLDPRHRSLMAEILSRHTLLPVSQAEQGEVLEGGRVYIAPPDQHMLVNADRTLSLTHTELVHFVRPSADLLFESLAASFGERAIAVVLTGAGRDGSMGIEAVKKRGGTTIVQEAGTAAYPGMPAAAISTGSVDFILPLEEISPALVTLVMKQEQKDD